MIYLNEYFTEYVLSETILNYVCMFIDYVERLERYI